MSTISESIGATSGKLFRPSFPHMHKSAPYKISPVHVSPLHESCWPRAPASSNRRSNPIIMNTLGEGTVISTVGTFRALVQCEREKGPPRLTASTEFRIKEVEFCEMSEEGALLQ